MLVAAFLALTPAAPATDWWVTDWLFGLSDYGPGMSAYGPGMSALVALAYLAHGMAVAGVAFSRWRPRLAMVLVLAPYATSLVTGYVAFGWWLGAVCILAVACLDGRWRHVAEAAALAVVVVAPLLLGGVRFWVFNLDIVIYRDDPVYVAITAGMYLVAIALVILVFSLAGRVVRLGAPTVTDVSDIDAPSEPDKACDIDEAREEPGEAAAATPPPDPELISRLDRLTPRERQVFVALTRGLTNAEIATELHIGDETVKSHVSEVLRKLECRDRVAAVIAAYESGFVARSGE